MATGRPRGSRAISEDEGSSASRPASGRAAPEARRPPRLIFWRLVGKASLAVALIAGVAGAIVFSDLDRYMPLDLRDKPGLLTDWRLRLLATAPEACMSAFVRSDIPASFAPPRLVRDGCGYGDAVILGGDFAGTPRMRCALAAAYASWMRHVVQPAAIRRLGSSVATVRTLGAFSCRDIAGSPGRRSQHATANAIDVAGFELKNGRSVSVAADWDKPAEGRFLREIRDGACGLFAGVLSPDWNAAHRDHFHLDMGLIDVCR